jgi:hypothetical protein
MGAVAFVVERRLLKVIKRRGREEEQEPQTGTRHAGQQQDLELTLGAKQVDDQPARQQAAHDPQDRG